MKKYTKIDIENSDDFIIKPKDEFVSVDDMIKRLEDLEPKGMCSDVDYPFIYEIIQDLKGLASDRVENV